MSATISFELSVISVVEASKVVLHVPNSAMNRVAYASLQLLAFEARN